MTDRLYYNDAYLTAFEARVVERAEDGRRVYLDRSAFYPASGGQPADRGSLGGVPIVDVVDEEVGDFLQAGEEAPQVSRFVFAPVEHRKELVQVEPSVRRLDRVTRHVTTLRVVGFLWRVI